MRIGVLEWDVSAMGGRHRTMMAFADYFVELGHQVKFFSNFLGVRDGWNTDTFLSWFPFRHLRREHFHWLPEIQRQMDHVPAAWKDLDVLLCSYGGWGWVQQHLPDTRVITWVIHPAQVRSPAVKEVWTNSTTTRKRLQQSARWMNANPRVIHPPHDYSIFREAARPWHQRTIEVVVVGSLLEAKGVVDAAQMAAMEGWSMAILGATWPACAAENDRVCSAIRREICGGARLVLLENATSFTVADTLGQAKVCLSLSLAESCSLVLYEAMHAGCHIVTRDIGSAREQLGDCCAHLYRRNAEAASMVRSALRADPPNNGKRAMLFDRSQCGEETRRALEGK